MLKNRYQIFICLVLIFSAVHSVKGQYGNEWINYDQSYYKIPINTDGVYQLTYNDLINAGLSLNTIDARTFKLYHRGEEVSIQIIGQADGRIDPADRILFLAKKNDGQSDTPLYTDVNAQPHTLYNIFSDETAYYLTYSLDGSFGKRMQRINPIANTNALPVESSLITNKQTIFIDQASSGQRYPPSSEVYRSAFDVGEGWTGPLFTGTRDFTISNILEQVRADDDLSIELLIQGRNMVDHSIEVLVGPNTSSLRSISSFDMINIEFRKVNAELDWSDISVGGDLIVRVVANNNSIDRVSLSYYQLSYNRSFNVNNTLNSRYELPDEPAGNSFVRFTNTNSSATLYRIEDFNDPQLLETNRVGNDMSTVIENTQNGAKLYFKNEVAFNAQLVPVSLRDLRNVDPNYVIVSHKDLNTPAGDYQAPVTDYANYRASVEGGAYDTLTVFMDQLFDQFNYGEESPMAIYRFSKYLVENTSTEFVFLVGKGIRWQLNPYRIDGDANNYQEYVPSASYPGSDNLYGFGLQDPDRASLIFGRLNSHTAQNVADYLDKIKLMESQEIDNLRRKSFLHLSGGLSDQEIATFTNYTEDFNQFARSPFIGGTASSISKQTTQVIEFINISEQVNQGLAMITFFGHSTPGTTDIDIGFVTRPEFGYQNTGKYPLIYVNGCNAGSIYERAKTARTFGENWVNTADLGAVHLMAHSAEGFPSELKRFSDIFYATAFGDSSMIDQQIGKIHKKVINDYLDLFGTTINPLFLSQAQQFNLMGDPAYKLFPADKPDFEILDADVSIVSLDGQTVDALTSDFAFDIIIRNLGITTDDSLSITVNRTLADGTIIPLDTQYFASPYNLDTLRYFVENNRLGDFGNNRFEIKLDAQSAINELNENNNSAIFEYFLSLGTTINLYPYNNSIINDATPTLTAQSIDLLSEERGFLFEVDTVDSFDSPFLRSTTISDRVIANWDLELSSAVAKNYYWRSKFSDPQEGELDQWTNSNFYYDPAGSPGWIQNTYDQISENDIFGLNVGENSWQFIANNIPVEVNCTAEPGAIEYDIFIDGEAYVSTAVFGGDCANNSLNLVAFDQISGAPYRILKNEALFDIQDVLSCGKRPQVINQIFNTNLNDPTTYFQKYYNELPQGDYVLISSYDSVAWNVLLAYNRDELLDLGASASTLDALDNGNPYVLLGQKGIGAGNGLEAFIIQQPEDDPGNQLIVNFNDAIDIQFTQGTVLSNIVGPVRSWISVDAEFDLLDPEDDLQIDVFGVDKNNVSSLLYSDASLPLDISGIDASSYPFIRLRAVVSDSVNFNPPGFNFWNVNFEELPDGVLLLDDLSQANQVSLAEGDSLSLNYTYVNATPIDFLDSVQYSSRLFNQTNRQLTENTYKIAPIPGRQSQSFEVNISTLNQVGLNDHYVEFEDDSEINEFRQVNNLVGLIDLINVKRDSLPPFVEVTFDGINILDGDIVSPSPFIQIQLKDENTILTKKDTSGIELSIRALEEGASEQRIYFSDPNLDFIPAGDGQKFTINYKPDPFEDGTYILNARLSDASGNNAGEEPYEVSFEVVNASTITHFFPYPNPFSTQTRFVFTLTGSEIPQEIKIQILTVTGRVVREILQDEIGMIHIGNNITEYAWDGTDEFGDRLANGVYLYRVLVRKDGQFMTPRATSADKAFKKGYGKLYILR